MTCVYPDISRFQPGLSAMTVSKGRRIVVWRISLSTMFHRAVHRLCLRARWPVVIRWDGGIGLSPVHVFVQFIDLLLLVCSQTDRSKFADGS